MCTFVYVFSSSCVDDVRITRCVITRFSRDNHDFTRAISQSRNTEKLSKKIR